MILKNIQTILLAFERFIVIPHIFINKSNIAQSICCFEVVLSVVVLLNFQAFLLVIESFTKLSQFSINKSDITNATDDFVMAFTQMIFNDF